MKSTTSERLHQLMSERNLRQVDILNLSQKYQKELDIKMGKSALSQYISGKSVPDQNKLVLLGKTLNVSEPWLMGYDVPKERNNNMVENNKETIDLKDVLQHNAAFNGKPLSEETKSVLESLLEQFTKE
ncbi:helix-turn-helix domain-containing protein [Streptococcus parauberis]|uniref:helix-turn-helix domain-containing protein n=1 Tax=Streptococcus parauberis TaxID=1348 RepID=UPI000789B5A9|nr:helix-turn-helix domain-containing protein [Streptococcus parauberis]KYP17708.1 helix-turn-helix protein [Streptococcus parauberis]KYP18638.1 helix-turn-helix protein [Streptococcus parauberis]KYP20040.1 helix-turn-helix protein [Streptococcus parauberis]KYP27371.1 helix-turn-helix protein [Streptococcus parauberis]KYP27637.1 helix-turn-helix protein [Streptococcus parauberis]